MYRGLSYEDRIKLFIEAQTPVYSEEYLFLKKTLFDFGGKRFVIKSRRVEDINLGDDFNENHFFDLIDSDLDLQNLKEEYTFQIGKDLIKFKKILNNGSTSHYYIGYLKENLLYFMKIPNSFDLLLKEIYLLKILDKYQHFPKIIQTSNQYIIMDFCGQVINRSNIPNNAIQQGQDICNILQKEGINHSDIKLEEILVKDDMLYLVDFGYARLNGRHDCGLKINSGKSQNDYRDDKDILLYLIERIQNPLQTYQKNNLLKNYKNKKWYSWKK